MLQQSTSLPYPLPSSISGATQPGVPQAVVASSPQRKRARPKSAILMIAAESLVAYSRFSGYSCYTHSKVPSSLYELCPCCDSSELHLLSAESSARPPSLSSALFLLLYRTTKVFVSILFKYFSSCHELQHKIHALFLIEYFKELHHIRVVYL